LWQFSSINKIFDTTVDGIEDGCRIYRLIVIKHKGVFSSAKQGIPGPVYRDY